MSNYTILQLNAKELTELKDIATELGLKVSGSAKKEQLVYDILDQQAIVNAQRKTADKPDADRKKRLRVSVKKKTDTKPNTQPEAVQKEKTAEKENTKQEVTVAPKVVAPVEKTSNEAVETANAEKKPNQNQQKKNNTKSPKAKKTPAQESQSLLS